MPQFLDQLQWRHATKVFDDNKKTSTKTLDKILEAIHMTPTSFGLQPYKVIVIQDQELKESLRPFAWDQPQITTCSELLVFVKNIDTEGLLESYKKEALAKGTPTEKLEGFEGMVRSAWNRLDERWAEDQAYIALGFAMAACAELEIDSCAMGGFQPEKFDEILKLPEHLKSCVLLPIGYRKDNPNRPKVRLPYEDVIEFR